MKKGNRVAKAAVEFDEGLLTGFHLVGFTICDDKEKGLFVLFPSSPTKRTGHDGEVESKPFFFLRPSNDTQIATLESAILDVYDSMTGGFNTPRMNK